MKYYTICAASLKITLVARSAEELINKINDESIDVDINWIASERNLDALITGKYRSRF